MQLDPDPTRLAAGRALTFAVMRAMADLDADRIREQITAVDRPALEWAYYFMCQSFFAAVSASVGEDEKLTQERILTFVQGCETMADLRDAVDEVDLSAIQQSTLRGDQP